ncbi:MAG TPA: transglycosylase SLT domain-containing protein [Gemmatimonadaceae bacterium]|nr:transglycosylase SLT domain-containing protein [Gemmatimonadaceae bacterium]
MTSYILRAITVALCTTGCDRQQASATSAPETPAALHADSIKVTLEQPARELVTRGRNFDRANQLDSARLAYLEAARQVPEIADWLHLRAAGVTADSNARKELYERIRTEVARDRIPMSEAFARERTGDIIGAIAAYDAAGSRTSAFRLRLARAGSDIARLEAERAGLLALIRSNAGSETSREAIAMVDRAFKRRTAAEELAIARTAARVGMTGRAAIGYDQAGKAGLLTSSDRFSYGQMLARLNRDADAAAQYARITAPSSLAASAQYQRARAQIAMRNLPAARATLRAITTKFPGDPSAAAALLLLADLATDESRDGDARTALRDVVSRFPSSSQAPIAIFRGALISFIQRDYVTAATELEGLVARYPRSSDATAARYWLGRARHELGDTTRSRATWRALMTDEPSSYYTVLASERLGVPLSLGDETRDTIPKVQELEDGLRRIALLGSLGMEVEQRHEYNRLFRDAAKSPERMVATAHAFLGTPEAPRAISLGWTVINDHGRSPLRYRLVHPIVQREKIASAAKANGLDPALVAALIKQESSFNPRATSPVGARGMMQIMPSLGERMARAGGMTNWNAEMLYDPAISIELGTKHLADLLSAYPHLEHGLAAYNAGATPVARWRTKAGAADAEVFTERIPFVETRDYVRAIVRNRAFYRVLYPW